MKLWQISRGSRFTIAGTTIVPPGAPAVDNDMIYQLGNIDGAYSYCFSPDGTVVHIGANTEVTPYVNSQDFT